MWMCARVCLVLSLLPWGACSDAGMSLQDAAGPVDLGGDKAATCASAFGTALTAPHGRLDGVIRAVVPPGHPTCAMPNGDHLVLQVDAQGGTYRMVVNVESDRAGTDPAVRMLELDHALPAPAFGEGWHGIAPLDYPTILGVSWTQFIAYDRATLVDRLTAALEIGARVSVYASTSGGGSAHLVHRNPPNEDGAIVVRPDTSPHWLLISFSTQAF